MYLIFFGKSCIKLYDRKLVTVDTVGVNSNENCTNIFHFYEIKTSIFVIYSV